MAYVTLFAIIVVMIAAIAALTLMCRYLVRVFTDAGQTRRNYRSTMEGLAIRTHNAAKADRDIARDSSEVAEATQMLARQVTEVQDTLALERKLRKAIRATPVPPPPLPRKSDRDKSPGTEASA